MRGGKFYSFSQIAIEAVESINEIQEYLLINKTVYVIPFRGVGGKNMFKKATFLLGKQRVVFFFHSLERNPERDAVNPYRESRWTHFNFFLISGENGNMSFFPSLVN